MVQREPLSFVLPEAPKSFFTTELSLTAKTKNFALQLTLPMNKPQDHMVLDFALN